MKYAYEIIKTHNEKLQLAGKNLKLILSGVGLRDGVCSVLYSLNYSYLPYYTQEITKLINNQRKEPLEIHISDDPEYDIPDDYIIVEKDFAYHPDEPEKKLETPQLLEFLHIMIKELNVNENEIVEPEY
jgi:hypothetical protein